MKQVLENFRNFSDLKEATNKDLADVNEILLAFMLAAEQGIIINTAEAEAALEATAAKVSSEAYTDQKGRAEAMKAAALVWAAENGFDGAPAKIWWTARAGVLQTAIGTQEVSSGNPTDVLIQFPDDSFLGVSAKSTKGKGDIGFKNPGVGAIGKALGIDLRSVLNNIDIETLQAFNIDHLPAQKRKVFIRAHPVIKERVDEVGRRILNTLRDFLLNHFRTLSNQDLRTHIIENWLDAQEIYPYYIKVTGRGTLKTGFTATVEDPIKNEKFKTLMDKEITLVENGNDASGVLAGGKRIMKMRFKYESQKLASSLKMSGDPWK